MRFDVLNRLGVDHECNGQTDGRTGTDRTGVSNSATTLAKITTAVSVTAENRWKLQ